MTKLNLGTTENDIKALVKTWYDVRGAWSYAPIQRGMGVHGIPDRVGCMPVVVTQEMVGKTIGLFVAVESKKPGRRGEKNGGAEPAQMNQLRGIVQAKGVGALVDGTHDLDWLTATIDEIRLGRNRVSEVLERRTGNARHDG
jgi:hypothetical protein